MKEQYNYIIKQLQEYFENIPGAVLGISGGKDSTIVAKLLVDAIGRERVLGVLMPSGEQFDISDSYEVCHALGIDFIEYNIWNSFSPIANIPAITAYKQKINITPSAKINVAPRLRMTYLYAIAQSLGYRVVGTGNMSEQYIGWCTKWGDMACDINPIAHLTCTEIVKLGDYMGLPKELVHKNPSDGLTGKSDEENFGFTYEQLDGYLLGLRKTPQDLEDKFRKMNDNSKHKFAPVVFDTFPLNITPDEKPEPKSEKLDTISDDFRKEVKELYGLTDREVAEAEADAKRILEKLRKGDTTDFENMLSNLFTNKNKSFS